MANYQADKRKKLTPRIRAWFAILALFIISIVLGKATWSIYFKNKIARENKLVTMVELADLEGRQKVITDKLERLRTPEGREEEIRKNLPMAKEGEYVITIVDDRSKSTSSGLDEATTTERRGLWQRWFWD